MLFIKSRRLASDGRGSMDPSYPTVVALGTRIEGTIESDGPIVISGVLEGAAYSADTVIVEAGGVVMGTIIGRTVDLAGLVDGEIRAEELVIAASGRVRGKLVYQGLHVLPGASLNADLLPTYHLIPATRREVSFGAASAVPG